MKCLRCADRTLDERERDGVVIDVCPSCRGVWLDRGELEKLLARMGRMHDEHHEDDDDDDDDDGDDDRRRRTHSRGRDEDLPRRVARHPDDRRRGGFVDTLTRLFD